MSVEQDINTAAAAKKMIDDFTVRGKSWKLSFIDFYASVLVIRLREFLTEQVELTDATQDAVQALCERLVDYICQRRLDSVLTSAVAAMTATEKECVAWTTLVKFSKISRRAERIVPSIIWNAQGTSYTLKFPDTVK